MSAPAASDPRRHRGVIGEFFAGFVVLGRGFAVWRRHPGLMALGFLPAFIVAAVFATILVITAVNIEAIGEFLTGFAAAWDSGWRAVAIYTVGAAVLILIAMLSAFAFTALSLLFGEPVYTRIWRAVETDLGGDPPAHEPGFWRSAGDAARLVGQAIVVAIVLGLIGIVPFVGPPVAAVLGVLLTGRLIALELTARPLEARGLTRAQRTRVLRSRNPRLIGFGVAAHLFYAVPLGAIVVMPAAVAAATMLARHATDTYAVLSPAPDSNRPISD